MNKNIFTLMILIRKEIKNLNSVFCFHKNVPSSCKYENYYEEVNILKSLQESYKELKKIEDNNIMPFGIFITPCLKEKIDTLDSQINYLLTNNKGKQWKKN